VPSYWIAHPDATAFISALTPEGIGEPLGMSDRWPVGRYVIRLSRNGGPPTGPDQCPWGHAIKEKDGAVRIEPVATPAAAD
jgi:hypothetical protein